MNELTRQFEITGKYAERKISHIDISPSSKASERIRGIRETGSRRPLKPPMFNV